MNVNKRTVNDSFFFGYYCVQWRIVLLSNSLIGRTNFWKFCTIEIIRFNLRMMIIDVHQYTTKIKFQDFWLPKLPKSFFSNHTHLKKTNEAKHENMIQFCWLCVLMAIAHTYHKSNFVYCRRRSILANCIHVCVRIHQQHQRACFV